MASQTDQRTNINIDRSERIASVVAGGALAGLGVGLGFGRKSWVGAGLAALGGGLVYRGATGHCDVKSALEGSGPVRVERTFTVTNQSPEEVYEFWRSLEKLPTVMDNLESVKVLDERRSHWVARGPAGKSIEWDAEITNDRPGRAIEWRSLPGSDLDISGSVRFKRKQGGGTKVHLSLRFTTPGGAIGERIANLLHIVPEQQVDAGLQSVREALEQGQES